MAVMNFGCAGLSAIQLLTSSQSEMQRYSHSRVSDRSMSMPHLQPRPRYASSWKNGLSLNPNGKPAEPFVFGCGMKKIMFSRWAISIMSIALPMW